MTVLKEKTKFWHSGLEKYPHGVLLVDGFPRWLSGEEYACQCRRCGFDPCVGKIPRRRVWKPTPVFLPGKSHGQRSPAGYSPWTHKRVEHNLASEQREGADQCCWRRSEAVTASEELGGGGLQGISQIARWGWLHPEIMSSFLGSDFIDSEWAPGGSSCWQKETTNPGM